MTSETSEVRILLFGRSGVGKSSLGNRILGQESFAVFHSFSSTTQECQSEERNLGDEAGQALNGKTLVVVDTPGLYHASKTAEEVVFQILSSISMNKLSPHVVLLVVNCEEYQKGDMLILNVFPKIFAERFPTIVVFTHCKDDQKVNSFLAEPQNKSLSEFIEQHGLDRQAFDKKADKEAAENQVTELLQKIDKVFHKNGGQCHSSATTEKVKAAIEEFKNSSKVKPADGSVLATLMKWYNKASEELEKHFPVVKQIKDIVADITIGLMPKEAKV